MSLSLFLWVHFRRHEYFRRLVMPEEIYDTLYAHLEDTSISNNPVGSSETAYALLESAIISSSFRLSYRQLNRFLSIPRKGDKDKSKWYTEENDKIHRLCFFSQTLELDYIAGILESPPVEEPTP